ncbi:hypothetical protein BsWGS_29161 [Bradybaena similaris]
MKIEIKTKKPDGYTKQPSILPRQTRFNSRDRSKSSSHKVQLQGQIKELKSQVQDTIYKNQEPEQRSSMAMQRILDNMKAIQEKILKDVAHLNKLKMETGRNNKENPRGTPTLGNSKKGVQEPNITNRNSQLSTQTAEDVHTKHLPGRGKQYNNLKI